MKLLRLTEKFKALEERINKKNKEMKRLRQMNKAYFQRESILRAKITKLENVIFKTQSKD